MKVTRRTDRRLIVEDQPWLISLLLGGCFLGTLAGAFFALMAGEVFLGLFFAVFSAFTLLFVMLFTRRVQLIFDRGAGTITMRTRSFKGYREVVHPFEDFSHAICEGYDTRRCVLVFKSGMSAGHHPVTGYLTNGPGPQRITDAINDWLRQSAPVDSEAPSA